MNMAEAADFRWIPSGILGSAATTQLCHNGLSLNLLTFREGDSPSIPNSLLQLFPKDSSLSALSPCPMWTLDTSELERRSVRLGVSAPFSLLSSLLAKSFFLLEPQPALRNPLISHP